MALNPRLPRASYGSASGLVRAVYSKVALSASVLFLILAAFTILPPPGGAGFTTTSTNSTSTYSYVTTEGKITTTCAYLFFCGTTKTHTTTTITTSLVRSMPATVFVPPSWNELFSYVVVAKTGATVILMIFHKLGRKSEAVSWAFNPLIDGLLLSIVALFFLALGNVYLGYTLGITAVVLALAERRLRHRHR